MTHSLPKNEHSVEKMDRILVFSLICSFSTQVFAQNSGGVDETSPQFDNQGIIFSTEAPKIGEPLRAECTVVNLNRGDSRSVKWVLKRPGELEFAIAVDSVPLQFRSPIPRLHAFHKQGSNRWEIEFSPLERNDFGNLSCELSNTHPNTVRVTRFLNVHVQPVILESSTRGVTANLGDSFTLECLANGYPPAQFQWVQTFETGTYGSVITDNQLIERWRPYFRKQESIISEGPILTVTNATMKHRGTYICSAKNGIGAGDSWTALVKMNFPPSVTCEPRQVGQAQQMNLDAYIECMVEAYPASKIRWYRYYKESGDRRPITDNPDFRIENSGLTDNIVSRLTVINVLAGDFGDYYLEAVNEYGKSSGTVTLYETPDPQMGPGRPDAVRPPDFGKTNVAKRLSESSVLIFMSIVAIFLQI